MARVIGLIIVAIFAAMLYFGVWNVILTLTLMGMIATACAYGGKYKRRNGK